MPTEAQTDKVPMELDLRGSICPGPTGDTLAALKKLPLGGKLLVTTDYPPPDKRFLGWSSRGDAPGR